MTATQCRNLLHDVLHNPELYDLDNCSIVSNIRNGFYRAFYNIDLMQHYQEFDGDDVMHFLTRKIHEAVIPDAYHYYGNMWFLIFCTFIQSNYTALKHYTVGTEMLEASITADYAPLTDLMLATIKGGMMNISNTQLLGIYLDMASYSNTASAQLKQCIIERMLWDPALLDMLHSSLHQPASDAVIDKLIYAIAANGKDFAIQLLPGLWQSYYYGQPHSSNKLVNQEIEDLLNSSSQKLSLFSDYRTTLLEKLIAVMNNITPHSYELMMDFVIAEDLIPAFYDLLKSIPGGRIPGMQWLEKIADHLNSQVGHLSLERLSLIKLFGHYDVNHGIIEYTNKAGDFAILDAFLHTEPCAYLDIILNLTNTSAIRTHLLSPLYVELIADYRWELLAMDSWTPQERMFILSVNTDTMSLSDWSIAFHTAMLYNLDDCIIQLCQMFASTQFCTSAYLGESLLLDYMCYGNTATVIDQLISTFSIPVDYELILEVWCSNNPVCHENRETLAEYLIKAQLTHLYQAYTQEAIKEYMGELVAAAAMGDEVTASGTLPLVDLYLDCIAPFVKPTEIWNIAMHRMLEYSEYGIYQKLECLADKYADNIDFTNLMQEINYGPQEYWPNKDTVYQGLFEAFSKQFIPQAVAYIDNLSALDADAAAIVKQDLIHAVHDELAESLQCALYEGYDVILDEMLSSLYSFSDADQQAIIGSMVDEGTILFNLGHGLDLV